MMKLPDPHDLHPWEPISISDEETTYWCPHCGAVYWANWVEASQTDIAWPSIAQEITQEPTP